MIFSKSEYISACQNSKFKFEHKRFIFSNIKSQTSLHFDDNKQNTRGMYMYVLIFLLKSRMVKHRKIVQVQYVNVPSTYIVNYINIIN